VRVIIAAGDRPPGGAPLPRALPAYSGSLITHAALLLCLMLASGEPGRRETPPPFATDQSTNVTTLVWRPVPGAAGGGGGGGNRNPNPPQRLQRAGTDLSSTPTIVRAVFGPVQPEPPEQTLVAPALLPLAGGAMNLPGALDPASFSAVSLGPGSGGGAGTGDGGGVGPGDGLGLGMGQDRNVGGARGAGANFRPPVVVRNVRPQYTTEAMRARIQGAVLVAAIVETDGTVRNARVVRSLDAVFGLDQAAVRAATQWVFRPATMDGQPVALAVTIELVFTLR
jgi:periplasmic protein TonB